MSDHDPQPDEATTVGEERDPNVWVVSPLLAEWLRRSQSRSIVVHRKDDR